MHAVTRKLGKVPELKVLSNQKGFTLLELLVVVAIMAAIAGTASIALKDTDARASAAAHVAMMDELNKGIGTYRVLNKNVQPSRLDSLIQSTTGNGVAGAAPLAILGFEAPADGSGDAVPATITAAIQTSMSSSGISALRYVNTSVANVGKNLDEPFACSDIKASLNSRTTNVVAGNIFLSPTANGCGAEVRMNGSVEPMGLFWNGGSERLTGQPNPAGAGSAYDAIGNPAYLLTGIGPSSTLFDTNRIGSMTTVPVYRHVKQDEYNRFIAVWNVGTYDAAGGSIRAAASVELVAIVDGALDTKEEELGEWDGTRNTI